MAQYDPVDEQLVRNTLKKMGFLKIRKKYGQRFAPIISGDKDKTRIWVHLNDGQFQTHTLGTRDRKMGTFLDLVK